ncbi:DNA repair protein RadC [Lysinibacillus sphaericus]|uniref:RadC family protein n=1 Tax=Lysinibacillus sphaericus TaxID=1421 RepID=UPI002163C5C8|nr:DNA repair protein RadC [Lysinibacillus sphaericus]MCS1384395.1 DNA repair protein RadC [Lysinibacillus sphaericus]
MTTINDNNFKSIIASTLREKEDGYILSEIFTRYPSIKDLLDVTEEELLNIKGIGKVKAQQIIAALQLARMNPVTTEQRFRIRSPQDAYDYLKDMQHLQQEHFVVLGLNTKNEVTFRKTIFMGSLNASICHPREIMKELIKRSCASAILSHNHPSGDTAPSPEDIQVTERLIEAGLIIGIDIVDHIIVGSNKYLSMKEKGYF